MKKGSIIKIIWLDTCHYPERSGSAEVIMEKATPRRMEDVGFYIGEDDETIKIACQKKEGDRWGKPTAVVKSCIKKIIEYEK